MSSVAKDVKPYRTRKYGWEITENPKLLRFLLKFDVEGKELEDHDIGLLLENYRKNPDDNGLERMFPELTTEERQAERKRIIRDYSRLRPSQII